MIDLASLAHDLRAIGLRRGDVVLVHSSYRSLGIDHPDTLIQALIEAIGATGTLLLPALSYRQTPPTVHNTLTTPSCVGFLAEYFRTRPGPQRSLHLTPRRCISTRWPSSTTTRTSLSSKAQNDAMIAIYHRVISPALRLRS